MPNHLMPVLIRPIDREKIKYAYAKFRQFLDRHTDDEVEAFITKLTFNCNAGGGDFDATVDDDTLICLLAAMGLIMLSGMKPKLAAEAPPEMSRPGDDDEDQLEARER